MDQAEETRQMEIEHDIRLTLDAMYKMLEKWDGSGYEEMREIMIGSISAWKARLEGDKGAFDE